MTDTRNPNENKNPLKPPNGDENGATKDVNLVDTWVDVGVSTVVPGEAVYDPNEVYGVKRGLPEDAVPGSGVVNGPPPVKRVAAGRPIAPRVVDGEVEMTNAPLVTLTPTVQKPKRARAKVRRLAVKTNTLNVWDALGRMNAGLSVLDWLTIDKEAGKDLVDGLRYLRTQRTKRGVKQVASDTMVNQRINLVGADSESEWYDTDEDSVDGEVSMVTSASGSKETASTTSGSEFEVDPPFDDVESVYRYPYDLNRMRISSPLKGVISINNVPIECVFDSGASVSVISRYLCEDVLGLVPNGDNIQLVGFDNQKTASKSNIIMDVPINIAGKIRPDHMCVQDTGKNDRLCLLGVPWFQAYGIEINLTDSTVSVPTTSGVVKLQCYTTHLPSSLLNNPVNLAKSGANVFPSLNDRFKYINDMKKKQVYMVDIFQKYCETLEDDLIPDGRTVEEVQAKFKYDESNITEGVPEELKDIVEEYKHCFSEVSGLSKIDGYYLDINLKPNAVPVRNKSFRLTWEDEQIMNDYIDEMLELDLIEESSGVWTSPCFLVPKKDGSKRCVIDYRKVNQMIEQTNYPMCTVSELTEATANAKYFSTGDLSSGYHQLMINPDSRAREITGFITKRGVFQYKVLPMGISIGCSEFQRVVSSIFKDYIGVFCYVFLDDFVCFSNTMEEHKEHLRLMFEACAKANLKLKRKKCHFGQESVEYLGHVIGRNGTSPSERNVEKVKNFPACSDVSELKSFLGLSSFMRKYMPNYSSEVACLTKLTRKGVPFVWDSEQVAAFNKVKEMLCSAPVLAYLWY